jgi:hypothetical protein
MTHQQLHSIMADPRTRAEAIADPALLPALPQTIDMIQALPLQLAPFQARWLLGNCSDEVLKAFRELYPQIVVQRFGRGNGTRYRYSKCILCRVSKVPVEVESQTSTSAKIRP